MSSCCWSSPPVSVHSDSTRTFSLDSSATYLHVDLYNLLAALIRLRSVRAVQSVGALYLYLIYHGTGDCSGVFADTVQVFVSGDSASCVRLCAVQLKVSVSST
jgi:hypothetical protein